MDIFIIINNVKLKLCLRSIGMIIDKTLRFFLFGQARLIRFTEYKIL